jgi:hypothetical protein
MSVGGKIHDEIEGQHATLTVYDDRVTIERGGFVAFFSMLEKTGEKEIPIREITAIEVSGGMVRINQRDYVPPRNPHMRDLNTISSGFTQDPDDFAERVKRAIRDRQRALNE